MEKKDYVLNYFNNRSTNASAESFNSKIKGFRAQVRGVADMSFFLYRMVKIFGQERLSIHRQSLLSQDFNVILEDFSQCLIQRTLGELPNFEVMTWQLCHLLRSALICVSSNSFHRQRYNNLCKQPMCNLLLFHRVSIRIEVINETGISCSL